MLYLTGYGLQPRGPRQFRQWGAARRATPSSTTRRASRSPPARWARASPTASAWASPRSWLRARFGAGLLRPPHLRHLPATADLEEGISHEAASLAGHLGLGRLVYVYDDNHISIDGPTELALSDDAAKRFEAYGWHVEDLGEVANDLDALEAGLRRAMAVEDAPSLLVLRSHIGYPSPKYTDTAEAHGNPLGLDEIRGTKEVMGLPDETVLGPRRRAGPLPGRRPARSVEAGGVGEAPG